MNYQPPTAPLIFSDVVAEGFRLFSVCLRFLYLPALLLAIIAGTVGPSQLPSFGPESGEEITDFLLRLFVLSTAAFFFWGFMTAIVHYIASGAPRGVPSPLAIVIRRFQTIVAVNLLYIIAVVVGTLMLFIPGLIAFILLFFSPILPITEAKGALDSLRGSIAMVRRSLVRFVVIVAITMVIGYVLTTANEVVAVFLAGRFESDTQGKLVSMLTYAAFQAIIQSLMVCLVYATYHDLRLRRDRPRRNPPAQTG